MLTPSMTDFDPRAFWETRHTRKYGPESVGYAGLGVPYNEWMYRVRGHVVARQLRKSHIDLSTRDVLDIGSGTGFYIELWKHQHARSVTGSDFAPYAVHALREKFADARFVELDITGANLPSELGQYDVISAFDILYHIVDDGKYRQAIANIRSLLRPGGYFILSENFLAQNRETGLHQVSRTYTEIVAMLEEHGFVVMQRAPVFFLMNRPLKSSSGALQRTWKVIKRVTGMTQRPWLGGWLGALLYPVELASLPFMSSGPSTEMMICRVV
ncbi:MAG TPA: class I SAM-dependent methyltransferase [Gemmatimonadaceae bacterium]